MPKPTVGVVGASARAAVHSLARAGYAAWAVDLFADRDLARVAPTVRCPLADYPHALPALAEQFPPGPVLYTGGLENHPDVVAALAARRPLWGNPPAVLEVARDPFFPSRVWPHSDSPVRCPRVLPGGASPADGAWLLKPRRSAGGFGIRPFHPADPPAAPDEFYLQELVPGRPLSAVFVAGDGVVRLPGMTEQLVGEPWLHAAPFHWAGNVGPVEVSGATERDLLAFGREVARTAGLVGLFGVDFIDAGGVAYPVEINPRYPASAEVIEFATGRAVMPDHAAGCGGVVNPSPSPSPRGGGETGANSLPASRPREPSAAPEGGSSPPFPGREGGPGGLGGSGLRRIVGKAVYYAPHRLTFAAAGPWDDPGRPFDPWEIPAFADVPGPGVTIEPGWPVLTVFESGSTPAEVRGRLQSRAAELDRLFAGGHTT